MLSLSLTDAPVQPVVSVAPTTFTVGTDVTLTCTSQTTGNLTYAWFKDGTATGDTSSSLTIISFQTASHAGAYSCKVTLSGVESLISVAVALSASGESTHITSNKPLLFTSARMYGQKCLLFSLTNRLKNRKKKSKQTKRKKKRKKREKISHATLMNT